MSSPGKPSHMIIYVSMYILPPTSAATYPLPLWAWNTFSLFLATETWGLFVVQQNYFSQELTDVVILCGLGSMSYPAELRNRALYYFPMAAVTNDGKVSGLTNTH